MRRTKIIATLGPACTSDDVIYRLLTSGVDVFRLNFSHGTPAERERIIRSVRDTAVTVGRYIPIIGDIQGPKIRIGDVDGVQTLQDGQTFVITTETVKGDTHQVSTPFTPLPREVQIGQRILINDGLVELVVTALDQTHVTTRVVHGGPISSKKGMNLPDSELTIPAITDKDREDVKFAVEHQLDYIAASFIRRRSDIEDLRQLLSDHGGNEINVIAKLEKPQALDNLEDIFEVSDGVMVARGDLGVELPPEAVPIAQKKILAMASRWGRFAITATQMLESMTTASRPTRAEASDVANAIFDGSDAVMLSAETASGNYPVEAVQMMARIVTVAEANRSLQPFKREPFRQVSEGDEFTDALAGAANYAADQLEAKFIVVFTQTGFAARLMSKFRPNAPIIAISPSSWVARRMNILWGVQPLVLKDAGEYHEQIVERVDDYLLSRDVVSPGDRLVILMGSPLYQRAKTNLLRVHRVRSSQ
ncbi:MAG TPA: pyruvate kinase [Thermoanaerobaculia bacterium]|jgi:pyruvate kinase|nr:pyruvate kinase [Thermoanaerobaculia bacterium]